MSPLLTNYSFLSPLRRQRALRATSSPSKCANRLPVLPEHSVEQDFPSCSSSISSSTCSSRPSRPCRSDASSSSSSVTSSTRLSPSEKRRSRYGRDEFALDPNFLRATTLDATSPAPTKQKHQTVRLSAYDIVIDISSPTSPVSNASPLDSSSTTTTPPRPTRARDQRPKSPTRPRTRSPTPSLTSMSACSSNDVPTTPLTSDDDEWPGLNNLNLSPISSPQLHLRKAPAAQRVQIHPLVINKPTTTASSATALEFTLADLEREWTDEDEVSWYARELAQVVSLASPCTPTGSGARPRADSLFPTSPSRGPRSRMSKPLPALPGPHPHLDPTFPRRRQALPPPVPGTTPFVRKSLKITVPRAPPRTSLPLDVADIFDDDDAWSIFAPSRSTNPNTSTSSTSNIGSELSPPRIPETPMSAYSAYDPVELIIDYANQPSPLPSLSSFLPEYDSDDEESWPTEEKLRSRWTCSTVAKTPSSPSASEKLRFHLGSVARRVRACRTAGEVAVVSKTHARSSSEPSATTPGAEGEVADAGVRSESGHEEPDAEGCLRRKPIPLELFLR
ncbi:hypothetical protein V8E53_007977 [Lactarius tabidus]